MYGYPLNAIELGDKNELQQIIINRVCTISTQKNCDAVLSCQMSLNLFASNKYIEYSNYNSIRWFKKNVWALDRFATALRRFFVAWASNI